MQQATRRNFTGSIAGNGQNPTPAPARKPRCPRDWMSASRPHPAAVVDAPLIGARAATRGRSPTEGGDERAGAECRYLFELQPPESEQALARANVQTETSAARVAHACRRRTRRLCRRQRRAAHRRTRRNARARRKMAMGTAMRSGALSICTTLANRSPAYIPHRNARGERCDQGCARSSLHAAASVSMSP